MTFWDVWGEQGHPVRATVSEMGPLLLARLLDLNETQEGVLTIVFKVADDNGLLLLDLKDLRAMLQFIGDNAAKITTEYGNVSAASIGAIQRGLLQLEEQGGDRFFGEPTLEHRRPDADGRRPGRRQHPRRRQADEQRRGSTPRSCCGCCRNCSRTCPRSATATSRSWCSSSTRRTCCSDAPPALLEKVEQVVRLIRSKGVGVYFVTQNPLDIPDKVLGQLGNRVQHALRAFTPRDQKAVKAAAETMRPIPKLDAAKAITELGVGEALVSLLDEKGTPGVIERAWMLAPGSQIGPITPEERKKLIAGSVVAGTYEKAVDRESAYEKLKARAGGGETLPAGEGGCRRSPTGERIRRRHHGQPGRHPVRLDRAARRPARRHGRSRGEERGALGRLVAGARDHARHAGRHPRRNKSPPALRRAVSRRPGRR